MRTAHTLSSVYRHDSATMMYSSRLVRLGWCYVLCGLVLLFIFFLTQASLRDNFRSIVFNLYFCFVFELSFIPVSTIFTTKSELFLSHPSRFSLHSSNSCRSSWDKATSKWLDERVGVNGSADLYNNWRQRFWQQRQLWALQMTPYSNSPATWTCWWLE